MVINLVLDFVIKKHNKLLRNSCSVRMMLCVRAVRVFTVRVTSVAFQSTTVKNRQQWGSCLLFCQ